VASAVSATFDTIYVILQNQIRPSATRRYIDPVQRQKRIDAELAADADQLA
jgi:hypothetical protein